MRLPEMRGEKEEVTLYTRAMNTRIIAIALLAAFAFSLSGTPALAATKKSAKATVAAPDPVQEATVNLYCRLRVGKVIYATSGTGVFISESGIILTNAHVAQDFLLAGADKRIDGWCSVRTGSPADETYTASVLYLPSAWIQANAAELAKGKPRGTGENDFALLYVTGAEKKKALPAKFPSVPLSLLSSTEGAEVRVLGYPTAKLTFSQVRNKLPVVTASTTVTAVRSYDGRTPDALTLAPSKAGGYGTSGGPVIENGKLIAIVTSKGSAENDSTLRAISLQYIDQGIRAQTGLSLNTLVASKPALLAPSLSSSLTPEIIKILTSAFVKKK